MHGKSFVILYHHLLTQEILREDICQHTAASHVQPSSLDLFLY